MSRPKAPDRRLSVNSTCTSRRPGDARDGLELFARSRRVSGSFNAPEGLDGLDLGRVGAHDLPESDRHVEVPIPRERDKIVELRLRAEQIEYVGLEH